ncbi:hypothetical protein BV898_06057 [Hypsibius exemplaris]|uniref:LITAF domain-containing protein n=1 Tax=Hypsibius exemplaris TaxID=2072580 RepID=A0A1W0WXA5_HYPEX|nr:hypothetical protein BV898_06057 [Hypsibius exemplaris]
MTDKQIQDFDGRKLPGGSFPLDAQILEAPPSSYTMAAATCPVSMIDTVPELPVMQTGQEKLSVTVVTGTPGILSSGPLLKTFGVNRLMGPDPMQGRCPSCGQSIVTHIDYEVGSHAQTLMCLFCFFGGLFCCWIPLCVPSMQDVVHSCPNCQYPLGRYNR